MHVYTVQLFVPKKGVSKSKSFSDGVVIKVFMVRAIHESTAKQMAKDYLGNPDVSEEIVHERDARFWSPDDLMDEVVYLQDGFLDPLKFHDLDLANMHRRIDKKFGR